ncbi:hypothetical protein [Frateuria sp. STR12]|uniref:hypothetical protein n=1 Tax=Frateuria hangzhouensis TaxID=2995589 RepID=UPI002260D0C9|nr:hypothetical protein [Frateuria sp. STR12]MCX7514416.1 hypothetical protein [Frateuria sp. STR12]
MNYFALAFKATAILHALTGCFIFGLAANGEIRESCVYQDRNPLTGDIVKYLAYIGSCLLIACGIVAFVSPGAAVALAWLSLSLYLLTAFVDAIAERRFSSLCKACVVMFFSRFVAAALLTILYMGMQP